MTFQASAGRIHVTDGSHVVFDTDELLFTVTDGPITGSVTVGPWTATRNGGAGAVNLDSDTFIASVNGSATHVEGQFYASSGGSGYGVVGRGWFNAEGTYLHYIGPRNGALDSVTNTDNVGLGGLAGFTFYCSGGSLYLKSRIRITAPFDFGGAFTSLLLQAVTFDYYLLAGTFV